MSSALLVSGGRLWRDNWAEFVPVRCGTNLIEPFLELATLLAEEAHGPQRWARLGREELPITNRLAEDGVGDIIGAQPNTVHP